VVEVPRSIRLDAGEPDHLGPFLGFFGGELAEFAMFGGGMPTAAEK
jgi:hypothetical protein